MKKINRFSIVRWLAAAVFSGCIIWMGGMRAWTALRDRDPGAKTSLNGAQNTPDQTARRVINKPKYVRGVHMTAWVTGSPKIRNNINLLFEQTELNTAVIDLKEYEGEVYLPGVAVCEENKSYVNAMPDLREYLSWLKNRNIYTIARIVVFKDNIATRRHPEWAVQSAGGGAWKDRRGITWLDPYNKEAWNYNLTIAEHAVEMGFDEIQFDYIRFPSDGNLSTCRYSQAHSSATASGALVGFLKEANRRLKPKGVNISIDVFGLTTTMQNDMGIGQRIVEMTEWVDYVCPMVYPSHYNRGEYGIPDPNKAPYRTVFMSMQGAAKRLGTAKLRPYIQDFSLGYHYGPQEVRKQIQAAYDNDIGEWLLWNPRCVYTRGALKEKKFMDVMDKSSVIPAEPLHPERDLKAAAKKAAQGKKAAPAANKQKSNTK